MPQIQRARIPPATPKAEPAQESRNLQFELLKNELQKLSQMQDAFEPSATSQPKPRP